MLDRGAGRLGEPGHRHDLARYCGRTARALAGSFGWACTLNEPNAQVTSKVLQRQQWAIEPALRAAAAKALGSDPFHAYFLGDSLKVRDVFFDTHAKGRNAIKAAAPGARVGITLALQELGPGPGGEALNRCFVAEARAPCYAAAAKDDFTGVQTYNRFATGHEGYLPACDSDRDIFGQNTPPAALDASIRKAHREGGVPVLVTENSYNTSDDRLRISHQRRSIAALQEAPAAGVPVLGYF